MFGRALNAGATFDPDHIIVFGFVSTGEFVFELVCPDAGYMPLFIVNDT